MENKKSILFLINPISGVGKKNTIPKYIDKYLNKDIYKHKISYTEYRKHGFEIAKKSKTKYDIIVAIGGDGTVNEIGSALIGSKTKLAIIPTGSGNGLARHLKIPLNIKNAIKVINSNQSICIDTATVNDLPFIGTCGFGFDAHIAKKFDEYGKRGVISYAKLIKSEFSNYKPSMFKISVNNKTEIREAFMYCVANSSQFGNGFTVSPKSDLQDGVFEHVFLEKFKLINLPLIGKQFFSRQINKSKFYSDFESSNDVRIEVLNKTKAIFHIDGEPMEGNNIFDVKIVPKSLNVIC